jgi:hypothetical protein
LALQVIVNKCNVFSGVGVQEIRGVSKLRFGVDPTVDQTKPVDNGIVTIWSAAEPDA